MFAKLATIAVSAALLAAGGVTAQAATDGHGHGIPKRACQYEDGPAPCYWDAGARGNGRGNSYWIDRHGDTHYLDPRLGR